MKKKRRLINLHMLNIKKILRLNRSTAIVSIIAIVLPVIGAILSLYILINFPVVNEWVKENPLHFFVSTALTMAVLLTPTTFIASMSGFLFGLSSTFYLLPAYLSASLLGYFISYYVDRGKFLSSIAELDDKQVLKNTVQSNPFWFVILCRISPVLPFGFMNIALPAFGVRLKEFIVAGTLGMLPRTVLFIWLGSSAQDLLSAVETGGESMGVKFYVTSFLILTSSFGLLYLFKRKIKQLKENIPSNPSKVF
mgnify:CR=1 FL=1